MISDIDLDLRSRNMDKAIDDLNNIKTVLSSAKLSSDFSSYANDLDVGASAQSELNSALNNAQGQMNAAISGLSGSLNKIKNVNTAKAFNAINGAGIKGGIITQLISLIMGIITLPVRFAFMAKGIAEGSAALAMSVDGLGKSVALAGKDLWILLITIISLISKYILCIISFTITTVFGCAMVHSITFILSVVFLIFPLTAFFVEKFTGYDLNPVFDKMFEMMHQLDDQIAVYTRVNLMRWPKPIELICYTCFGMPVALKDVLVDVWSIKTVGDMIAYDFSIKMPQYMKRGAPLAKAADKSINKATATSV